MKTILILPFLFFQVLTHGQTTGNNIQRIEVGCSEGRTGSFAYSAAAVDRLVKYYIPDALQVQNSALISESGNYYLKSEVFYAQGWGTALVKLEREGGKLYIGPGSCAHLCVPVLRKGCVYPSEITAFDSCVSVTCGCSGGGESTSKVESGDLRSVNLVMLSMRNVKSLCD